MDFSAKSKSHLESVENNSEHFGGIFYTFLSERTIFVDFSANSKSHLEAAENNSEHFRGYFLYLLRRVYRFHGFFG